MQVWPCGLAWIYCSSLLFACKHAVCKETYVQGQVLMSKVCTGWACTRPSMPQASSPANTPVQLFLTMVWMLWIHLGHCQQCGLQDSVYSLRLNQLPKSLYRLCPKHKRCSGEQNAKLPCKSNFWVITKTTVLRINIQQFLKVHFVFIYAHFFQCFMPQIVSKDVKCHF